eukprot:307213-Pyramimonas_sp.AAC.1
MLANTSDCRGGHAPRVTSATQEDCNGESELRNRASSTATSTEATCILQLELHLRTLLEGADITRQGKHAPTHPSVSRTQRFAHWRSQYCK